MNEVSIIINGVRYDSYVEDIGNECNACDLRAICENTQEDAFNLVCYYWLGRGLCFKKSDKKFEK